MSQDVETRTTPELLAAILDEMKINNEHGAEVVVHWRTAEERAKEEHVARMDSYKTLAERNTELAKIDALNLKQLQRQEESHARWTEKAAVKIAETEKRLMEVLDAKKCEFCRGTLDADGYCTRLGEVYCARRE